MEYFGLMIQDILMQVAWKIQIGVKIIQFIPCTIRAANSVISLKGQSNLLTRESKSKSEVD